MVKTARFDSEKIFTDFEKLSASRKKEVAEFISFLKSKEELEATKEIIKDKDFINSILNGDIDFKNGDYKKWDKIKQSV